jgi:hypothetical protein
MQGAAGHHPWGVVRSDSTSLGAEEGWCRSPAAAAGVAVAVRERRTGQAVVPRGPVHFVGEGKRRAREQRLVFATRLE